MQVASILSWLEPKYAHPPDRIWRCRSCSAVEEMHCFRAVCAISATPGVAVTRPYLLAYSALCPARRRHSSMNFSTSAGSNLKGLRPGPIFTAGRYGLRLPEACCTTHEMLTLSLRATSAALMSCRIGVTSAIATGKIFACSMPFTRCILASHTLAVPSCFLFTEEAELCQTDAPVRRFCGS